MGALTEAVVFFKGSDVVKEMFFAEFEAVLDDVVGIPDFASDEIQAAFVQIEDTLGVTGVVFGIYLITLAMALTWGLGPFVLPAVVLARLLGIVGSCGIQTRAHMAHLAGLARQRLATA